MEEIEPTKRYKIDWVKRYHASGSVVIQADTLNEAIKKAESEIGNYEGTMQYNPDEDEIEGAEIHGG